MNLREQNIEDRRRAKRYPALCERVSELEKENAFLLRKCEQLERSRDKARRVAEAERDGWADEHGSLPSERPLPWETP